MLRLGSTCQAPSAWQLASSLLLALRGAGPEDEGAARNIEENLTTFLRALRQDMAAMPPSPDSATLFSTRIIEYIDLAAIRRIYAEYNTGDLLDIMVEAFRQHLIDSSREVESWSIYLDAFEGLDQITDDDRSQK